MPRKQRFRVAGIPQLIHQRGHNAGPICQGPADLRTLYACVAEAAAEDTSSDDAAAGEAGPEAEAEAPAEEPSSDAEADAAETNETAEASTRWRGRQASCDSIDVVADRGRQTLVRIGHSTKLIFQAVPASALVCPFTAV